MNRLPGLVALLLLLAAAPFAQAAVGFQHFTVPDPLGPPLEVGVWYPTDAPPAPTRIELFEQELAVGAPVKGEKLPLVVISHGTGGSYAGHADTAFALAQAGFVAAALTHTGDNWRDHSRAVQIWDRSRQLKALTDYMLGAWRDHARLDPDRVGAFGFSAGGFTVLVAAGGEPDLAATTAHCKLHPEGFECRMLAHTKITAPTHVAYAHDARIKALVVAAPALGYTFGADGLAAVRQPVQLWRAADDRELPAPFYAEAVRQELPQSPEFHDVPNAGHFDFLAPCSAALAKVDRFICTSARDFDRTAFHAEFNREVVRFFVRRLQTDD
jgi:predicted dienelactone hydrolase